MKTEQARATRRAQQAEVQRLTEQFDRHTMFAPFDGWVSAEHTEIGQWVMQGDPVAEIVELNQVDVEIAVVEDYVANLDTRSKATSKCPRWPARQFTGHVAIINPQADARARTFPVKVRVENASDKRPAAAEGRHVRPRDAGGRQADAVRAGAQGRGRARRPTPMVFVAADRRRQGDGPARAREARPGPRRVDRRRSAS